MQCCALPVRSSLPVLLLVAACADVDPSARDGAAPGPAAPPPGPNPAAMDHWASRRTRSPDGRWEVRVADGGVLTARRGDAADATDVRLDTEVDARVAFAGDTLYYAKRGEWAETDLWRVALPDGKPTRVTAWAGSEDRPVVSPDGRRLAFVSGRTGLASWWVVELEALPAAEGTQVTNVGVTRGRPGQPPEGYVPVPDGTTYRWEQDGLEWVSAGVEHRVVVPK